MNIVTKAINLYSETNPNMEIVIIPNSDRNFEDIKTIAENAYAHWFRLEPEDEDYDEVFDTAIGDYIHEKLREGGYELGLVADYKMYYDSEWD